MITGTPKQIREVLIPIRGNAWIWLKAEFPLTKSEWDQMLTVLDAMKPGLIEPEQISSRGEGA